MDVDAVLKAAIGQISSDFPPNQLAYYALTSKPEREVRDVVAYSMHLALAGTESIVTREWKRIDLAVLQHNTLSLSVELKCAYTFDCVNGNPNGVNYGNAVIMDLNKSVHYASDSTKIYAYLMLVHPKAKISSLYHHAAKYAYKINRSLSRFSEDEIASQSITNIRTYFSRWNLTPEIGHVPCGTAFGVDTELITFLFGPLSKQQITEMEQNGIQ